MVVFLGILIANSQKSKVMSSDSGTPSGPRLVDVDLSSASGSPYSSAADLDLLSQEEIATADFDVSISELNVCSAILCLG